MFGLFGKRCAVEHDEYLKLMPRIVEGLSQVRLIFYKSLDEALETRGVNCNYLGLLGADVGAALKGYQLTCSFGYSFAYMKDVSWASKVHPTWLDLLSDSDRADIEYHNKLFLDCAGDFSCLSELLLGILYEVMEWPRREAYMTKVIVANCCALGIMSQAVVSHVAGDRRNVKKLVGNLGIRECSFSF